MSPVEIRRADEGVHIHIVAQFLEPDRAPGSEGRAEPIASVHDLQAPHDHRLTQAVHRDVKEELFELLALQTREQAGSRVNLVGHALDLVALDRLGSDHAAAPVITRGRHRLAPLVAQATIDRAEGYRAAVARLGGNGRTNRSGGVLRDDASGLGAK